VDEIFIKKSHQKKKKKKKKELKIRRGFPGMGWFQEKGQGLAESQGLG